MSKIITKKSTKAPLLNIKFLSHGTLESRDLQASRRFYEEVLGLEVIQQIELMGSDATFLTISLPVQSTEVYHRQPKQAIRSLTI
jgi:catechol 2,3-dioxygenase-like lactoylglutathione lyase family enzyme